MAYGFYTGHDPSSDAFFDDDQEKPGKRHNDTAYGGYDSRWEARQGPNGEYAVGIPDSSGAEEATRRYQQMGAASNSRQAPVTLADYTQAGAARGAMMGDRMNADLARGSQTDALGLMQSAAYGQQPSQAQILGGQMIDQSLDAQMAAAASARGGPLAQAAAQRQAQMGAAQFQQQGMGQLSALRADEMARARDAYMGGASTMRGQDYQGAGQAADWMGREAQMAQFQSQLQTQAQLQQEQLNQQNQQYYEGLGHDVTAGEQQAGLARAGLAEGAREYDAGARERKQVREDQMVGGMISGIGNLALLASDAREKVALTPLRQRDQQMGELEPWLPPGAFPSVTLVGDARSRKPSRSDRMDFGAHDDASGHTLISDARSKTEQRALGQAEGYRAGAAAASYGDKPGGIVRTDPYGLSAGGYGAGIIRDNPYGDAGTDIIRANPYGEDKPKKSDAASAATSSKNLSTAGRFMGIAGQMMGGGGGAAGGVDPYAPPGLQPTVDYRMYVSDERSKNFVNVLEREPEGVERHYDRDVSTAPARDASMGASLSGPTPRYGVRGSADEQPPSRSSQMGGAPRQREMTPDEMMAAADAEIARIHEEQARAEARGPAVHGAGEEVEDAPPAQMMDAIGPGKSFRYRSGVPGTDPAETHYGTTTQDLRSTPMGASMVVQDPRTGYDAIDTREAVGPTLASLGNLNERLRRLEAGGAGRTARRR